MSENMSITKNKIKKNIFKKTEWDFNVPDNKNDILKIASLDCRGFVTDYEIRDNEITAKVKMTADILYIPEKAEEGAPKLSSLTSTESFTIKSDIIGGADFDFDDVRLFIGACSPELINSRKVGVRANVTLCVTLIKNKALGIRLPENVFAETKTKTVSAVHIPVQISERVAFSHSLTIPNGKPDIKETLRFSVAVKDREVKTVTGKAVFKGGLEIKLIYISGLNTVECFISHIPFTEIADAKGLTDDTETMLSATAEDTEIKIYSDENGKSRSFDISGFIHFTLCAFTRTQAELVCDAFCPEYKSECVYEDISYSDISKCLRDAYTFKTTLTLSHSDITEICDISGKILNKEAIFENGKVKITSDIIYDIVYKASDGIKCERKTEAFEFMQDAQIGGSYNSVDISCEITGISFMIASSDSIEVRSNILFETRLTKEESVKAVKEVKIDKVSKASEVKPPITAYFPNEREEIWDIAKKYGVAVERLKKLNSADGNYAEAGSFLIIE